MTLEVGNNIKKLRTERHMSQSDLAKILDVSRQTISSWEINRTEPNMGMVEMLARAFRCNKSDIIGEIQHPFNEFNNDVAYGKMIVDGIDDIQKALANEETRKQLIAYARFLTSQNNDDL